MQGPNLKLVTLHPVDASGTDLTVDGDGNVSYAPGDPIRYVLRLPASYSANVTGGGIFYRQSASQHRGQ